MKSAVLTSKVLTEADLQALPDDGYIHERVGGDLVTSPKNDFIHGSISSQSSMPLPAFVKLAIVNR
jgi:hypothetical protein